MKKIFLVLSAAALAIGLQGCQGKTQGKTDAAPAERVIRIGFVDSGQAFPVSILGVAMEKGYIDAKLMAIGAKAEIIPFAGAGPAINEAFASGIIDMAFYGDVPNVVAKSNGIDTRIVAAQLLYNNAGIAVLPNSDFKTVKDLKGKNVAGQKGSYMHRTLAKMLEANGLGFQDINFVNVTSREAGIALVAGQVDAAILANINLSQVLSNGSARLLLDCSDNPEWMGSEGYIVTSKYLTENREVVKTVISGLVEALDFCAENPQEAKTILQTKSGLSKEIFDFLYPDNKLPFNLTLDESVIKTYEDIQQFLLENSLIKNEFSVRDWADTGVITGN
jgi:sulfonate transport system substrate-binding protein